MKMCKAFPKQCETCGRLKLWIDDLLEEEPDSWMTKWLDAGRCHCNDKEKK